MADREDDRDDEEYVDESTQEPPGDHPEPEAEEPAEGAALAEGESADELAEESGEKKLPRRQRRSRNRFRTLLKQNADSREENDRLKGEIDQEREARKQLEARLAELENAQSQAHKASLAQQITGIKEDLRKAVEDGETERQLELMERMTDLKVKQAQQSEAAKAAPVRAAPTPAPAAAAVNRAVVDEWKLNNSWFDDPEYSHYAAMAERLEQKLIQEGYAGFSKELFTELDKRLEKAAPEIKNLRDDDDDEESEEESVVPGKPKAKAKRPPPVVAGAVKQPPRKRQSGNGFSEQDRQTMQSLSEQGFAIDPNNPKHREAWAKYARRTLDDDNYF